MTPPARTRTAHASRVLQRSGLGWLLRHVGTWHGVLALAYHRIGEPGDSPLHRGLWSMSAEELELQATALARESDVISADDLDDVLATRRGRHVLITFDDGYRDAYEHAYPALRRAGVPSTFFLATGFIDHPQLPWWDEIARMVHTTRYGRVALRNWFPATFSAAPERREATIAILLDRYARLRPGLGRQFILDVAEATGVERAGPAVARDLWLTWPMVREMQAGGMTIGGHTVSHPVLSRVSMRRQEREIASCIERIVAETDAPVRTFSYPIGGRGCFDARTRAALRDRGVRYSFSSYGGAAGYRDLDPLDFPRISPPPPGRPDRIRAVFALPQAFGRT